MESTFSFLFFCRHRTCDFFGYQNILNVNIVSSFRTWVCALRVGGARGGGGVEGWASVQTQVLEPRSSVGSQQATVGRDLYTIHALTWVIVLRRLVVVLIAHFSCMSCHVPQDYFWRPLPAKLTLWIGTWYQPSMLHTCDEVILNHRYHYGFYRGGPALHLQIAN